MSFENQIDDSVENAKANGAHKKISNFDVYLSPPRPGILARIVIVHGQSGNANHWALSFTDKEFNNNLANEMYKKLDSVQRIKDFVSMIGHDTRTESNTF